VDELDFDRDYIHENRFPVGVNNFRKVDEEFSITFDKICRFLAKIARDSSPFYMKNNYVNQTQEALFNLLKTRFEGNKHRHPDMSWDDILKKLEASPGKLWSLQEMERTGGEPDVIEQDHVTGEYLFYDCSAESPAGRRSLCYDRKALESRKEHKPLNNALDMADEIGIEILNEAQYRQLQELGPFDCKTSSWIKTPESIRELGGALFGDWRYGQVFIYHNGAESYYAARGFRGLLRV